MTLETFPFGYMTKKKTKNQPTTASLFSFLFFNKKKRSVVIIGTGQAKAS